MRLINADKLKFKHKCHYGEHTTRPYTLFCISFEEIQKAPTIQAIPIKVLDKIRAEIMSLDYIDEDKYEGTSIDPMIDREDVLEIINKYKAESEG